MWKSTGPAQGSWPSAAKAPLRVFVIDGGSYGGASQVTIKDLTIEDGLATSDLAFPPSGGGILDLMASLKLRDCVLNANQAPLGGAGAMIYRGSLDDSGSTWTNNVILGNASSTTVGSDTLGYNGSGVDVFASVAISGDSSFTSNTYLYPASTYGGGISAEEGSTLSVSGSTFNGNQAGAGGAISVQEGSTLSVSGGTFDGNQAFYGGGIQAIDTDVTVLSSYFTGNNSQFSGGAIGVGISFSGSTTPQLTVKGCSFFGNQSGYAGGAIRYPGNNSQHCGQPVFRESGYGHLRQLPWPQEARSAHRRTFFRIPSNQNIPLAVTGCTFIDNQASLPEFHWFDVAQGGAIWNQIAMTVTDSTFSDNSAESDTGQGGAIADDPGSEVTIVRSSFVGNQAVGQYNGAFGGAIFTDRQYEFYAPTTTDIIASSFTDNTVTGVGAYMEGGAIADGPNVPPFPGERSPSRVRPLRAIRPQGLRWAVLFSRSYRAAPYRAERPLSITSRSFDGNQAIGFSPLAGDDARGVQAFGGAINDQGPSVSQ